MHLKRLSRIFFYFKGAVFCDGFLRNLLDSQDAHAEFLVGTDQLSAGGVFSDDNVVAVQDGKGFVADKGTGAVNRVAQPLGFFLAVRNKY